jgi:hypothetical protein
VVIQDTCSGIGWVREVALADLDELKLGLAGRRHAAEVAVMSDPAWLEPSHRRRLGAHAAPERTTHVTDGPYC